MYTQLEALDLVKKLKHLEETYCLNPKEGVYYEISAVIPAPLDKQYRQGMLEICNRIASPEQVDTKILGEYMVKVPDEVEFEIAAMGMAFIGDKSLFHLVSLPFGLSKANPKLRCDFIVRVTGDDQE